MLALAALRDAALPIVILLVTAVAGSGGLDTGALERGAPLPRARRRRPRSLAGFMRWRSTSYTVDERGVHWQSG